MTKRQYLRAMGIIQRLMNLDPGIGTLEGRTLRLLAELAQQYEINAGWGSVVKISSRRSPV